MSPQNNRRRQGGFVRTLLTTGLFLSLAFIATYNRQYIYDSVLFWSYQPSSEMSEISKQASMSDKGVFTFYATHPEVDGSHAFNDKCGRKEQNTAVIGCYVDNRIYIYNVTDSRLSGIKEVTAAHEMLHAAYQRLGDEERNNVNAMIEAEYVRLNHDPELVERMAFYARTEPGERDNELHSIIGTEVETISPQLEAHYAKYFSKRSIITGLYASYNQTFKDLENQTKALAAQLDVLKGDIDKGKLHYTKTVNSLNDDIAGFKQKSSSGGFSTQSSYNNELGALQARIDEVNGLRESLNTDIERYRELVERYNATVTQSQDLYKSIDSTLTPAPKV